MDYPCISISLLHPFRQFLVFYFKCLVWDYPCPLHLFIVATALLRISSISSFLTQTCLYCISIFRYLSQARQRKKRAINPMICFGFFQNLGDLLDGPRPNSSTSSSVLPPFSWRQAYGLFIFHVSVRT